MPLIYEYRNGISSSHFILCVLNPASIFQDAYHLDFRAIMYLLDHVGLCSMQIWRTKFLYYNRSSIVDLNESLIQISFPSPSMGSALDVFWYKLSQLQSPTFTHQLSTRNFTD